jgi:hypothetical protein
MAGPTPTEQAMIGLLTTIRDHFQKISQDTKRTERARNKSAKTRSMNTTARDLESLEKSASKTAKSMDDATRAMDNAGKQFNKSLVELAKDAFIPARKTINETMRVWKDSYDHMVDGQTSDYKKLAENARNYMRTQQNAAQHVKNASGAFKEYVAVLRNVNRKVGKDKNKLSSADRKAAQDAFATIRDSLGVAGVDVRNTLTTKEQQLLDKLRFATKLTEKQFKDLGGVLQKVGANFEVITDVSHSYATGISEAATSIKTQLKDAIVSLAKHLKQIVTVMGTSAYKDLLSQARNAVASSNYPMAARLEVSQADLSDFIGKNRMALRAMGNGNSLAPVNNGSINALQDTAHGFGLHGKESLDFIGGTMNSMLQMGLQPTVEDTTKQMKSLYQTMQETGTSFEELSGIVADLSKSPAFLQLVQARGYDGQTEMLHSLQKMVTQQGYSADYLKQLLDLNKNSQYAGIEETVKGMVGIQLLSGQVNRMAGRQIVSNDDIGLLQELKARGTAGLARRFDEGKYDNVMYNGKPLKDQYKNGAEFAQGALQTQLSVNKSLQNAFASASASDNLIGGAVNKTILHNFMGLAGTEYQQQDDALTAQAKLVGMTGLSNPPPEQMAQITGSKDTLVKSFDEVSNAFTNLTHILGITNQTLANFVGGLLGIKGNPAGQAAPAIIGAVKDVAQIALLTTALGRLGSFLPAVGGAAGAAGAGGILGGLGTGLATVGAGLGAGVAVGGAGIAGYGLGTAFNKAPELLGWDDISTNILDFMDWFKDDPMGQTVYHTGRKPNASTHPDAPLTSNTPVVPQGDTLGELLAQSVKTQTDTLTEIRKVRVLTEETHKEYMDFIIQNSNDEKLRQARVFRTQRHVDT